MPKSIVVALLFLFAGCDARSTPTRSNAAPTRSQAAAPDANPRSAHLVPSFSTAGWNATLREDIPVPLVDAEAVSSAMKALVALEGAPELSTDDDRLVLALLKDYLSGAQPLNIEFVPVPVGNVTMFAGYTCETDVYSVPTGMRMPEVQLAVVIYHEATHAADCRPLRKGVSLKPGELGPSLLKQGKSYCQVEYRGAAAGIRAFAAFMARNGGQFLFSTEDPRPRMVVDSIVEMWPVLRANRFCSWFQATQRLPSY